MKNQIGIITQNNIKCGQRDFKTFEILMIFGCAILSINILIYTMDLLTLYLTLELFSFTSFFLILLKENKLSSLNGFIYFIINTISSIIILIYILVVYKSLGFINLSYLNIFLPYLNTSVQSTLYGRSTSLINLVSYADYGNILFLGFILKLGMAPFHFWILSLYDSISQKITFYISTIPKLIYSFIIIKFIFIIYIQICDYNTHYCGNIPSYGSWAIIAIFIILSLIFGSILGINNKRIIKLFASSSISNTGFILLFIYSSTYLINVSNETTSGWLQEGVINISQYSIYHYIILYIINIYNFFYVLLLYSNLNHIYLLKDLKWSNPIISFILFISILSFIGIPPLSGFYNKIYLFFNCLSSYSILIYFLLFIGIIASIINTNFYLYMIKYIIGKRTSNYKETKLFKIENYPRPQSQLKHLCLILSFIFIFLYPLFSSNYFNIINLFIY